MATVTKPIALDESFNTTEVTPRNIADVLAEGLSHITGRTASEVEYDNTDSGLTSDDVQGAIDEIAESVPTLPSVDIQTAVDEFETYNGGLLSECKVALSPNQDLHGYPNPWVGGAGKNKLPLVLADIKANNTSGTWSGNVYSYNGSTITVNTDESGNITSIDVTNTPSAAIAFNLFYASGTFPFDINSTYTLNGCPSGGAGTSNYKLDIIYEKNGINNVLATDTGSEASANFNALVGATSMTCRIVIYTSASLPKTFYPMIRLATESDPTFAPYSNICPITGHTEVKVGDDGKNWANPIQGNCTPDGTISSDTIRLCNSDYIPVKVGQSFTVSAVSLTQKTVQVYFRIFSEKGTQNVRQSGSWTDAPLTISIESREHFLQLVFRNSDNSNITPSDANIQLELGSTATSYEPYNGYQVTVNLGGTYYSGTLDVVTGVLTVDKAGRVFDGTENWEASDTGYYLNVPLSDAKASALAISNLYKYNATTWTSGFFGISSGKNLWVGDANLLSVISADNLSVVYELENPTHIQLTPQQVKALVGENHLSAPLEGQEITESKYKQTFTFDDVIAYIQSLS